MILKVVSDGSDQPEWMSYDMLIYITSSKHIAFSIVPEKNDDYDDDSLVFNIPLNIVLFKSY